MGEVNGHRPVRTHMSVVRASMSCSASSTCALWIAAYAGACMATNQWMARPTLAGSRLRVQAVQAHRGEGGHNSKATSRMAAMKPALVRPLYAASASSRGCVPSRPYGMLPSACSRRSSSHGLMAGQVSGAVHRSVKSDTSARGTGMPARVTSVRTSSSGMAPSASTRSLKRRRTCSACACSRSTTAHLQKMRCRVAKLVASVSRPAACMSTNQ